MLLPRLTATLPGERDTAPIGAGVWTDTWCRVADEAAQYRDLLTPRVLGAAADGSGARVPLSGALAHLPLAVRLSV